MEETLGGTQEPVKELHEFLFNKGTLVDLNIGKWAAIRKLDPGDMLLGEGKVDTEALYLGHKRLLPKKALHSLVHIEGKARTALAKKSIPFPIGDARFVYFAVLPGVLEELKRLRNTWNSLVGVLLQEYPELRLAQLEKLNAQAESIMNEELKKYPVSQQGPILESTLKPWLEQQKALNASLYPDVGELEKKFKFGWRLFKVSATEGLDLLSEEELKEAKAALQSELKSWTKDAAKLMHQALGEAAANAAKLLEKNGKLNPKNLKPLFEAFETFRAIDFTGTAQIRNVLNELEDSYGVATSSGNIDYEVTAESINANDEAKQGLAKLLNQIGALAVDDVAEKAGVSALASVGRYVDLS